MNYSAELINQASLMLFLLLIFYFLVILPQRKRVAKFNNMLANIKRGDKITFCGGILGEVVHVRDAEVEVSIAPDTRIKIVKEAITSVRQ